MDRKWQWIGWILCWLGGILGSNTSVWACRYNVRDVGFVQFGSLPYRLVGFVNDRIPQDRVDSFRQITFASLLDSNVELEIVNTDRDKDHPDLVYFPSSPITDTPVAVLVSSENRSLPISVSSGEKWDKEALWNAMTEVVSSPIRESIALDAVRNYAVIVLFEGVDNTENQRGKEIIGEVIDQVKRNLVDLPKEVKNPPVLRIVTRNDFAKEKVLLWSIGIDPNNQEAHVAVMYGRARQIGSVLRGKEITRNALSGIVSVIGMSCECGLDRTWMMGTMIPFSWSDELREEMAQRLNFDPESPMVRTEISQIMANGAMINNSTGRRQLGIGNQGDLLMGYGEMTLETDSPDDSQDDMEQDAEWEDELPGETPLPTSGAIVLSNSSTVDPVSGSIAVPHPMLERDKVSSESLRSSTTTFRILVIAGGLGLVSILGGLLVLWKAKG
mgnify:CR=1 FL=1